MNVGVSDSAKDGGLPVCSISCDEMLERVLSCCLAGRRRRHSAGAVWASLANGIPAGRSPNCDCRSTEIGFDAAPKNVLVGDAFFCAC